MRTSVCAIAACASLLTYAPVLAHEDYEKVVTPPGFAPERETPDRPLEVVLHWTDGIVFYDPVKLVIRTTDGKVLAETDYYRDIVLFWFKDAEYAVAMQPWSVFYHRVWRYESGELLPIDDLRDYELALLLLSSIADRLFAYATSVLLCVGAAAAWFARKGDSRMWRWMSLLTIGLFGSIIAIAVASWSPPDVFLGMCVKVVAAMLVVFCIRRCGDARGTLSLSVSVAILWMGILTLYGNALPLLILLVAGFVVLIAYFFHNLVSYAGTSPPRP